MARGDGLKVKERKKEPTKKELVSESPENEFFNFTEVESNCYQQQLSQEKMFDVVVYVVMLLGLMLALSYDGRVVLRETAAVVGVLSAYFGMVAVVVMVIRFYLMEMGGLETILDM